jgi:hypothetical protein
MTIRRRLSLVALAAVACLTVPAVAGARVLLVGRYHGIQGRYRTIQSAVNAAKAGDRILVGPGDYKESTGKHDGVRVTTPRLHLRGMDRNRVIVDGSRPGGRTCDSRRRFQDFGPSDPDTHKPGGRNGVEIFKRQRRPQQRLQPQRLLRQPVQWGYRRADQPAQPGQLLPRQPRHERPVDH